jgi:hypothetical protein
MQAAANQSVPGSGASKSFSETPRPSRLFLLSPANASAVRAQFLLNKHSKFELAQRFQQQGAPLAEIFSFISSLYFRGKFAYANKFSNPPTGLPSNLVMTTSRGLLSPDTIVKVEDLKEMSRVPIDPKDGRFRDSLYRDALTLAGALPLGSTVVLLGSIASPKYVQPLLQCFGSHLFFPRDFVGRGDMSRGGLMLRCVQSGVELEYVAVDSTIRCGPRPEKLRPVKRK